MTALLLVLAACGGLVIGAVVGGSLAWTRGVRHGLTLSRDTWTTAVQSAGDNIVTTVNRVMLTLKERT